LRFSWNTLHELFFSSIDYAETPIGVFLIKKVYLENEEAASYAWGFQLFYAAPLIILFILLIGKNIWQQYITISGLRRPLPNESRVSDAVSSIRSSLGIPVAPIILIKKSPWINARICYGICIEVTEGALELEPDKLRLLLAHELHHLRHDGFSTLILQFLSSWTLFGSGFLLLTQSSTRLELAADASAVRWAQENGISTEKYIELLKDLENDDAFQQNIFGGSPLSMASSYAPSKWLENPEKGIFHSQISNLRIFFELFFGDKILPYFHPTLEQREDRINRLLEGSLKN